MTAASVANYNVKGMISLIQLSNQLGVSVGYVNLLARNGQNHCNK